MLARVGALNVGVVRWAAAGVVSAPARRALSLAAEALDNAPTKRQQQQAWRGGGFAETAAAAAQPLPVTQQHEQGLWQSGREGIREVGFTCTCL